MTPRLLPLLLLPLPGYASDYAPDRVIVALEQGLGSDGLPVDPTLRAEAMSRAWRFEPLLPRRAALRARPLADVHRVWLEQGEDPAELAASLSRMPGVRYAEPDHRGHAAGMPDDPSFGEQWALYNDGTFAPGAVVGADIGAPEAWEITTGSASVLVAVLDTGANPYEPEIEDRWWVNPRETADNGVDDDGNGLVDDARGWDFAYGDALPDDVDGHGSNVLGIVGAAGDNGIGVAGLCWSCELMVLKVLDDEGWGYYATWAEAIVYAVDHGAQVINLSAGGTDASRVLEEAMDYADAAGVAVVVSMMNEGTEVPYYPAAFPTAIAVGATDPADRRAHPFTWGGGSSYGDHIDVVAPGNRIWGLAPDAGDYTWWWSGTSQAAPHVAGTIALLLSVEPGLTPEQSLALLTDGAADEVGRDSEDVAGWDRYHGWGRIDAAASLQRLLVADLDGDGFVEDDCDPQDDRVYPGAQDAPGDDVDADCDGVVECYADEDGDGVGDASGDAVTASSDADCADPGESGLATDCDDADPAVAEVCAAEAPGGCACASGGQGTGLLAGLGAVLMALRRRERREG